MEEKFKELLDNWKSSRRSKEATLIYEVLNTTKFEWDIYNNMFIIKYPNLVFRQVKDGKVKKTEPAGDGWLLFKVYNGRVDWGVTRDSIHAPESQYLFSHVNSKCKDGIAWISQVSFCFGASFFNNVQQKSLNGSNELKLFLFNLREFLEVENLDGGPYHRFENNMGNVTREISSTSYRDPILIRINDKRVLLDAAKKQLIKANISYVFGVPYAKITIEDEEQLASFLGATERTVYGSVSGIIKYTKLKSKTTDYVDKTLFNFKGEEIKVKTIKTQDSREGRFFLTQSEKDLLIRTIYDFIYVKKDKKLFYALYGKEYKEKIKTKNGIPIEIKQEIVRRTPYTKSLSSVEYIFDEITTNSNIAAQCEGQIDPEILKQITVFV